MTTYGIDVSSWNNVPDWSAVRGNNISFASVKLTQGDYYVSRAAGDQVNGARAAGIAVGGYHFGDYRNGARGNVDKFVGQARDLGLLDAGSFLPMLDLENSPSEGITWDAGLANSFVADYIRIFRETTGVAQVAVYANLSFFRGMLRPDDWADAQVFLWLALYNGQPGDTAGWSHPRLAIHQFNDQGNVPGVGGHVDRDVTVNGFELDSVVLGGAPIPPPSSPPPPSSGSSYVVQSGDTLSGIGARLGIDWHTIAQLNGISPPYTIYPGQQLALPDAGAPTPPPPPPPPPAPPSGPSYTVQAGDTLSEIGARLGIDWQAIAQLNGIVPPYTIYPGQQLAVPDAGGTPAEQTYVVQAGDTLSGIGEALGVDWHDIAARNGIEPPYTIYPDQRLVY